MSRYTRNPNRGRTKIQNDIVVTAKITREDIYDLVKQCRTKTEAAAVVTEFIRGLPDGIESIERYGREESIERIVRDLGSYKEWDDDR